MGNKRKLLMRLTVIVLLGTSLASGQQVQWLQYKSDSGYKVRNMIGVSVLRYLPLNDEKPKEVELPEFTDEQPLFAQWSSPMAKNGFLWIALDRSGDNGPYDRLYIDANGDGSLKDETAVTANQTSVSRAYFGPVRIVFPGEDGPVTYHLNLEFYVSKDRNRLCVYSDGWYEGNIKLGEQMVNCLLIDHNANGTFNDKSLDPDQCDGVRIGSGDMRFVGKYFELEGELYQLEIAPDGAYIKLAPASNVTYGKIRLPESITKFAAAGENGCIPTKPEKGVAKLPVGKYRINHWVIERKDDRGIRWELEGRSSSNREIFEVSQTHQTTLEVGEPIMATLAVSKESDSTYSFSPKLKGQRGDNVLLPFNGIRSELPKIHIINEDGSYDRIFSFEYG